MERLAKPLPSMLGVTSIVAVQKRMPSTFIIRLMRYAGTEVAAHRMAVGSLSQRVTKNYS